MHIHGGGFSIVLDSILSSFTYAIYFLKILDLQYAMACYLFFFNQKKKC